MGSFGGSSLTAALAIAASLLMGCEGGPARVAPPELASARAAATGPSCTPTGAHVAHSRYACTTCHSVAGSVCFDPAGPAQAPGAEAPTFDPVAKTCSSVACHGMYEGTFEYAAWDWGCECLVTVSVPYGGNGGATPSWFATGLGCGACHGNPPRAPDGSEQAWHSAYHGQPSVPVAIQCGTCHPAGVGNNATGGTAISPAYASQHGNGVLDVAPRWTQACFGCH